MVAESTRADTRIKAVRPLSRFGKWFRDKGWRHLVAYLAIAFAVLPVIYVVSSSINPLGTLTSSQVIPEGATLDNYRSLFEEVPYRAWYKNTMVIAGGAALAQVLLSALSAYAFSRMRFKGRRTGLLAVLFLPLVAPVLAVVFLLSFIFLINEVVLASAVLGQGDDQNFTLAIGLERYLSDQFNLRWGPYTAGALLLAVPVIVLFQFLQRWIVSGLTAGGVKG